MKVKLSALLLSGLLGVGLQGTADASDNEGQINLTIKVILRTCSFDNTADSVTLTPVAVDAFTGPNAEKAKNTKDFLVTFSCPSIVESVKIVPYGTPAGADGGDFANTGSAQNVALRLSSYQGATILRPDGTTSVTTKPSGGSGSYTFRAGYVATGNGPVKAGSFESVVNLKFEYP